MVAWGGKAEVKSPKLQLDESILSAGQPEIMKMMKFNEKKKKEMKSEKKGYDSTQLKVERKAISQDTNKGSVSF